MDPTPQPQQGNVSDAASSSSSSSAASDAAIPLAQVTTMPAECRRRKPAKAAPRLQADPRVQALVETEFRIQLKFKKLEYQARTQALQRDCEAQTMLQTWSGTIPPPPTLPTILGLKDAQLLDQAMSLGEIYKPEVCQFIEGAVAARLVPEVQKLEQQLRAYEHDIELYLNPIIIESLEDLKSLEAEHNSRGRAHIRMGAAVYEQLAQDLPAHLELETGELRYKPWIDASLSPGEQLRSLKFNTEGLEELRALLDDP